MPHDHHEGSELDAMTARVMALETILTEKGLVDPAALDEIVEVYEERIGPRNGAKVVARAWSDPGFADWLGRDATAAVASMGFSGREGEHLRAAFNAPGLHNLVVCTLCSCYPWSVLGLPPVWYKSPRLPLAGGDRPARRAGGVRAGAAGRAPRSGSGTRPRRCATWWCRCAPRAARGWTRRRWPRSSPATR